MKHLQPHALGLTTAITFIAFGIVMAILAALGIYTEAYDLAMQWHISEDLSIGSVIVTAIEHLVLGYIIGYFFGWIYNKTAK